MSIGSPANSRSLGLARRGSGRARCSPWLPPPPPPALRSRPRRRRRRPVRLPSPNDARSSSGSTVGALPPRESRTRGPRCDGCRHRHGPRCRRRPARRRRSAGVGGRRRRGRRGLGRRRGRRRARRAPDRSGRDLGLVAAGERVLLGRERGEVALGLELGGPLRAHGPAGGCGVGSASSPSSVVVALAVLVALVALVAFRAPFAAPLVAPLAPAAPLPDAASRIASTRSALRRRVTPLMPIAPAMAWSCSRSLPSSIERSSCCSAM